MWVVNGCVESVNECGSIGAIVGILDLGFGLMMMMVVKGKRVWFYEDECGSELIGIWWRI